LIEEKFRMGQSLEVTEDAELNYDLMRINFWIQLKFKNQGKP